MALSTQFYKGNKMKMGMAFLIRVLYAYKLLIYGRGFDDGYNEKYLVCFS